MFFLWYVGCFFLVEGVCSAYSYFTGGLQNILTYVTFMIWTLTIMEFYHVVISYDSMFFIGQNETLQIINNFCLKGYFLWCLYKIWCCMYCFELLELTFRMHFKQTYNGWISQKSSRKYLSHSLFTLVGALMGSCISNVLKWSFIIFTLRATILQDEIKKGNLDTIFFYTNNALFPGIC